MDAALEQQQQSAFTSTSDSDLWDAIAELLASIDEPVVIECQDSATLELEDASDTVAADLSMSGSLSEEDFEAIARRIGRDIVESVLSASRAEEAGREVSPESMAASLAGETTQSADGKRRTAEHPVRFPKAEEIDTKGKDASTALTLPATRNTSLDEARRERNRLKVCRLYYRKLDRMNALRAQVTDLEENLERLKVAQSNASIHTTDTSELSVITTHPLKPRIVYAELLQELLNTKQRLHHENESLRHIVSQHVESVHAISVKLMEVREPPIAYLNIKSVTRLECAELRRRTFTQVHNTHFVQNNTFQFSLEKTQPNLNADQVGYPTWAVLCDPNKFARLYSLAVDMKCHLIQTVDDDNFVIFHEFRTMNPLEERLAIVCTIFLVSRVHTEPGSFFITLTSLDRGKWALDDLTTSPQGTVVWNNITCWMQYTDEGPDGSDCACLFAGHMPIIGSNVGFWTLEMVQLAVRCGRMGIGSGSYSLLPTTTDEEGGNDPQG